MSFSLACLLACLRDVSNPCALALRRSPLSVCWSDTCVGTFAAGCAFSYTPLTRVPATRMVVHESTLYRATTPRRCRGPFAPRTFPGSYTDTRVSLSAVPSDMILYLHTMQSLA